MGELIYSLVVKQKGQWIYLGIRRVEGGNLNVSLSIQPPYLLSDSGKVYLTHANGLLTLSEAKDPVAQGRVHSYFWSDTKVRDLLPRAALIILVSNALMACDP